MTPAEMATQCADAIERGKQLRLVLPRRCAGARRMRVFGRRGPLAEVCCENSDGHTVVLVDPTDLLAFLAAQGLVTVKAR